MAFQCCRWLSVNAEWMRRGSVFIIIHAIGNLHVFLGPNDFNGYGYFYVRLYWTGKTQPCFVSRTRFWCPVKMLGSSLLHKLVDGRLWMVVDGPLYLVRQAWISPLWMVA